MNSIQTPPLFREKKGFLFYALLCSLAFTNVALGGTSLIRFEWDPEFHPFTNDAGSATIEAEWIVYPDGLEPENNFYLTATNPHMAHGIEILFFYFDGQAVFKVHGQDILWLKTPAAQAYIGTREVLGETRSVMRYRFSNVRTMGPKEVRLTCNPQNGAIDPLSNGDPLPQSTIYVYGGHTFASSGEFQVVTSAGPQNISYDGTTSSGNGTTSFLNCTGGIGTLTAHSRVEQLSGNSTKATHFQNTVWLWNYIEMAWVPVFDQEFDHDVFVHDCTVCGGCGGWGPNFESNGFPPSYTGCQTGFLPPIGVVDLSVSIDGGPFVQGNADNSSFAESLNACGQAIPYERISYLQNYQWIIRSPEK